MRNYFLTETAFTHRKFVFSSLEKNGQAHVAIATTRFHNFAYIVTEKIVIYETVELLTTDRHSVYFCKQRYT